MLLRTAFEKAAKLWPKKAPPQILFNLGNDNTSRGDIHGALGIARALTQKMNADYQEINPTHFNMSGDEDNFINDYEAHLLNHMKQNGFPDIFFGKCSDNLKDNIQKHNPRTYVANTLNETLSRVAIGSDELVAHNITADDLSTEGEKFKSKMNLHHDKNAPLIGIIMTRTFYRDMPDLIKRLKDMATTRPNTTLFISTIWRTDPEQYQKFMTKLNEAMPDHAKVVAYDINNPAPEFKDYNPYIGLLDQADHLIIWGQSTSIVSECLATGKTPHVYKYDRNRPVNLIQQGCINEINADTPPILQTRNILPMNVTETLSQEIHHNWKNRQSLSKGKYRPKPKTHAPTQAHP